MADRVLVFDTTLRDGAQAPGVAFDTAAKLEIARALEEMGVDVIESGFPRASDAQFADVAAIARETDGPVVAAIARADATDIECAWAALRDARRPRLHVFCATSDLHIEHELRSTRAGVLEMVRSSIAQARSLCDDVEFTVADATRADVAFTAEVIRVALAEGATTINVTDTVGYATPDEFAGLVGSLYELAPGLRDVVVSVHCHDDLGLAVANTFAGVRAGARQVQCSVNGLGERAGNAALEEVVMLLHTRGADFGLQTAIDTTHIAHVSHRVAELSGITIAANKAVVGRNAFVHSGAIHRRSMAADRATYEIMSPATIGMVA